MQTYENSLRTHDWPGIFYRQPFLYTKKSYVLSFVNVAGVSPD